jgi:hypothetical protein
MDPDAADIVALGLDLAASALAIVVVVELTARQVARAATVGVGSEPLATPGTC